MSTPRRALARAVCEYSSTVHGSDVRGVKLCLTMLDGSREVIELSPEMLLLIAREHHESGATLNTTDRKILEALRTVPGDRSTRGEDVARMTEYEYNGRFKERLARLVNLGFLTSSRAGYRLAGDRNGDRNGEPGGD